MKYVCCKSEAEMNSVRPHADPCWREERSYLEDSSNVLFDEKWDLEMSHMGWCMDQLEEAISVMQVCGCQNWIYDEPIWCTWSLYYCFPCGNVEVLWNEDSCSCCSYLIVLHKFSIIRQTPCFNQFQTHGLNACLLGLGLSLQKRALIKQGMNTCLVSR